MKTLIQSQLVRINGTDNHLFVPVRVVARPIEGTYRDHVKRLKAANDGGTNHAA